METSVSAFLTSMGAHHDVVKWAEPLGDDWERAYRECPRADWLLGIAAKRGAEHRSLVLAACACARFALDYLPDADTRPERAIEVAERWANDGGHADVAEAMRDAEAAVDAAPDPAVAAAATAALASIAAIESKDHVALAAASAVQAAMLDAGDCAVISAMGFANDACLQRVRAHLTSLEG